MLFLAARASGGEPFIPVSEIRAGMKGYGKTVFSSAGVERFDVEVIAVWEKMDLGRDLILIRCSGGGLEESGIVAGMSGSPIYLDGDRLAGALSIGWLFAKAPIAGVTPIHEMLPLLRAEGREETPPPGGAMPGRKIATPLFLSGFHQSVIDARKALFEGWGMTPMAGGAAPMTNESASPEELEPGAPLSVALVQGDLSASAIGTVTYRDGDELLAFGHSFINGGPLEMPIGTAKVHTVMPSYFISFKLGNGLAPLGTLTLDRSTGIAGRIGGKADLIDVTFRLTSEAGAGPVERRVQVARHRELTPALLAMAGESLLLTELRGSGEMTLRSTMEVDLARGRTVRIEQAAASVASPLDVVTSHFARLSELLTNPYEPVRPLAIRIAMDVDLKARISRLDSIRVNRPRYRPGDEVELIATVRDYGGELRSRRLAFPLPEGLEATEAELEVLDAEAATARDASRNPDLYAPKDLPGLLERLDRARKTTSLYVRLSLPRAGILLAGKELPSLPGSVMTVFSGGTATGAAKLTSDLELEIPLGGIVVGQQKLSLEILPESER